jgi:hypothetical protein
MEFNVEAGAATALGKGPMVEGKTESKIADKRIRVTLL